MMRGCTFGIGCAPHSRPAALNDGRLGCTCSASPVAPSPPPSRRLRRPTQGGSALPAFVMQHVHS